MNLHITLQDPNSNLVQQDFIVDYQLHMSVKGHTIPVKATIAQPMDLFVVAYKHSA